ncbi:hypothetical protein PP730_23240, partial [Ralstonia solanacearum]|nr:hypothetical protein [Ralstonia solanacearum]
ARSSRLLPPSSALDSWMTCVSDSKYYQYGIFPNHTIVPLELPPLVTSELKPAVQKELDRQQQERAAAEARQYQNSVDWSKFSNMRW